MLSPVHADNGICKEHHKPMPPRKILFFICMIFSVFCLAAGYSIAGQWIGACASILMVPAWLFVRKHPGTWLPSICLFASVGLAVAGRLTGSPSWLMICSSGIALAVWISYSWMMQWAVNHLMSKAGGMKAGISNRWLWRWAGSWWRSSGVC